MRDLNLNEFAAILREELQDIGVTLPKALVYQMTKAFFKHAEETAASGNKRFMISSREVNQIYPIWDIQKLCGELAEGGKVVTAEYLMKKGKMQNAALRHYKKMAMTKEVAL